MISKSKSNDSQKSTHTVAEESKAKRDGPCDDFPQNSIKTGT
mgnify:FL=1